MPIIYDITDPLMLAMIADYRYTTTEHLGIKDPDLDPDPLSMVEAAMYLPISLPLALDQVDDLGIYHSLLFSLFAFDRPPHW